MSKSLNCIFNPRSVVVIGASDNPQKWGNWISKSLIESSWQGNIYLINPRGGEIFGRKTYPTVLDIEGSIDLALIGIPVGLVPEAVKQCVEKSIAGIIVISAGFGETGEAGKNLENQIVKLARERGTRIVGPNCAGIYNSSVGLNATIVSFLEGPVSLVSQSGNFGLNLNFFAKKRGLGFNKWISSGNQADVTLAEYLEYVKDDPDTRVIMMYIEELRDGKHFLRIASETTRDKPVVVLKVGATSAGARSAASHTGALVGSDVLYDAAFKQAGVIRVASSDELLDTAEAFVNCPLPRGDRVAILSDGGGDATMAADAAEAYGLQIPLLREETQEKINSVIPKGAVHSLKNPVDFAGEADLWCFAKCSEVLLQDEEIDALLIVGGFGSYKDAFSGFGNIEEDVAVGISDLARHYGKPLLLESNYFVEKPKSLEILRQRGVPIYDTVERAARCLAYLVQRKQYLDTLQQRDGAQARGFSNTLKAQAQSIIARAKKAGRWSLVETEARELLVLSGLPVSRFELATSGDEAVQAAKRIGYPVAMKIVSPDIVHKSEANGVMLDLKGKSDVLKAFDAIVSGARAYSENAEIHGVIITPMESKGTEVIVGMKRDKNFGPVLMFGLGGIFVEVIKDVSFRIAPLTDRDAHEMIREVKGFPILEGLRGREPVSIDSLADVIVRLSILALEIPEISEVDLNPVFALPNGASIVDARMILGSNG
ncbi:MAG: acetate--CoA ligase family protein [Dehalococcoidia bacterium]